MQVLVYWVDLGILLVIDYVKAFSNDMFVLLLLCLS